MTVRRFEQKKCIFLTEPTGSPFWAVLPDSQRMTFFLFKSELENSVSKKDARKLYRLLFCKENRGGEFLLAFPPNFLLVMLLTLSAPKGGEWWGLMGMGAI